MSFASVFSRLLGAAVLLPVALHAQSPGSLDTGFLSSLSGSTIYAVTDEYVPSLSGPLEYIPSGGDQGGLLFQYQDGVAVANFAYPNIGGEGRIVYTIVPEQVTASDGTHKLLVGGLFGKTVVSSTDTLDPTNLVRLNLVDGSIDPTFNVGYGADSFVTSILPFADGTMLVGGLFTKFNKQDYPRLVLLGPAGYIDTNFKPVPVSDGVFAMAPEYDPATGAADGKVIISGTFSTIGSGHFTKLARVDLAGNVDPTFQPQIDSRVLAIATQPDGKIVIGGEFSIINGQTVGHLARLNQDGSLDPTFNASVSVLPEGTSAPVAVYLLKLLPDGQFYVGGQFSAVDGVKRNYLGLINPDGSLDAGFDPGDIITNSVQTLAVQLDGRILVGETLSKKNGAGVVPPSLVRLYGGDHAVVNLAASRPDAQEGGHKKRTKGRFSLSRTGGDISAALTVYFRLGGTAAVNADYFLAKATRFNGDIYEVTFAANQTVTKVKVKPRNVVLPDAPATVTLTAVAPQTTGSNYEAGTAPTATVFISNAP